MAVLVVSVAEVRAAVQLVAAEMPMETVSAVVTVA